MTIFWLILLRTYRRPGILVMHIYVTLGVITGALAGRIFGTLGHVPVLPTLAMLLIANLAVVLGVIIGLWIKLRSPYE